MKHNNVLFITLKVFSAIGGIEKVCKVVGKALYEYSIDNNKAVQVYAMYGKSRSVDNNRYFPAEIFRSFGGNKVQCIIESVKKGYNSEVVILSHINLLLVGWLIKKASPSTKIILFTHGIEVWRPLSKFKTMMLHECDEIISVSHYTSQRIQEMHKVSPSRIRVINNCLDPFLPSPSPGSEANMRKRYGLSDSHKVLFTLTRLSAKERYKGYDNVMKALVPLVKSQPGLRYLLAGTYDAEEKKYLDELITELRLNEFVIMTGYVADEELAAHFSMADIYVMPSMKEGFGIVFVEAMFYNKPVIAGNQDGSVDALLGGELGLLVDPESVENIRAALEKMLANPTSFTPNRELLLQNFSYENYKVQLNAMLDQYFEPAKALSLSTSL